MGGPTFPLIVGGISDVAVLLLPDARPELAFLEIQISVREAAECIPSVGAISPALNCRITVQVDLGMKVLGFFPRLPGREGRVVADLRRRWCL